ncbi:MAG: hypothetical protein ACFCU1_06270 [Sumerlaeia bacterium]
MEGKTTHGNFCSRTLTSNETTLRNGQRNIGLSEVYDPTNGTVSFGDLIRSASGTNEVAPN